MCLAAKRSLQGRAAKLMLCGSAILSLFSCVRKQKFLHFIAVVSGFVALCLTTRYNDGTAIPLVTDSTEWVNLITPGFCWYNNDAAFKNTYGALYNWFTVNTGKLAPTGWRIPTDADWTILTTFLGGDSLAGGKLKETGTANWQSPNISATNETGFTAIPGGYRGAHGQFEKNREFGYWWSSTEKYSGYVWSRGIYNDYSDVFRGDVSKNDGFSVRCLRNI